MPSEIKISGRLLTKNWGLNLGGQALPLLATLLAIPYIVRGLGVERFGLLTIAWAVLGSLGLFDFGLGRATTKFVAESLGRGGHGELPSLVWTSLVLQVLFGLVGGLLGALVVQTLVQHYLRISPQLRAEAKITFFILAASFPVVLGGNALRGVLEAFQLFKVVNYVKVPISISVFLLPAVAMPVGLGLPAIVLLLVVARVAAAIAYLVACGRVVPGLRRSFSLDYQMFRPLLVYGGWITISNFISPLLTYSDRFLIGSFLPMSSLSYYTVPSEATVRASVVPGSLVATLFPAFASLDANGSVAKMQELCIRSIKSLLLIMGPGLFLVVSFAPQILRLWLGRDFASQSSLVLQILSVGAFFNSLAFVPFCLLKGLGRPDLTAKFHLLEFPAYLAAMWFLLPRMGLVGAAVATSLRLCVDGILLFGAIFRLKYVSIQAVREGRMLRTALAVATFGVSLVVFDLMVESFVVQLIFSGLLLLGFGIAAWLYALDQKDRGIFFTAADQIRAGEG